MLLVNKNFICKNPTAKCNNTNYGAAVADRKARYSLRIEMLTYPTCIRRPRYGGGRPRQNIAIMSGAQKLEWCGYPTHRQVKFFFYLFRQNSRTIQTDTQTDTA